ncbi:hypothetical protein ACIBKY_26750 [Nonomuraea sp. NPDC050394]|uniref:hypothetical protein n=1 Tax=Nonomuraea sp. NPDC050394 TaxID=3364363 RepID=UPI0037AA05F5
MSMTVGELVAIIDADDRGFDSGLDQAERRLQRLDAVTTSTTDRIESTVERGFARVAQSISDGMDPDDALKDLSRLVAGIEQSLSSAEPAARAAGERAGDAFVRGADGRLRDGRGRFVAEGKNLFDGLGDGAERSGGRISSALGGAFDLVGKAGPANVGLAGAAIAGLPAVATVAAAGITLALGGALVAVGVMSVAQGDAVQQRWTRLGRELRDELADVAQPMEGSVLRAADVAERVFARLKPSLRRTFEDLVPDVDRFIDAWGDGIASMGPSLENLGAGFGDILDELATRSPEIFTNLNSAIDTLAGTASDHADEFGDLVVGMTKVIDTGADVVSVLADIWEGITEIQGAGDLLDIDPTVGVLNLFDTKIDDTNAAFERIKKTIGDVGGESDSAAAGVRNFKTSLDELFNPAQAALGASNNLKDAIAELTDGMEKGTIKGRERGQMLEEMLGKLAAAAETEKVATGETEKSSAAFEKNAGALAKLAGSSDLGGQALVGLAESLGYTVERTKTGIKIVDEFGKTVTKIPPNKDIKIDADSKQAQTEVGKVTSKLGSLKGDATKAGADLGGGLIAGIRSMIGSAVQAAKDLAASALKGAKDFLGIKSPSTVMAEVGRWTVRGLIQGLTEEEGQAVAAVQQMVAKIKDAFKSQPDVADGLIAFVTKGNDSLAKLAKQRDELVQQLAAAKEMAKTIAGDAKEWASITGLNEEELQAGDFSGALKSRAQSIKDFANDIQTLAKRGLNKETLRQIIEAGVDGGASIAEMLVGADGSEIKAINKAQKQIDNMSKKLGKSGADALYDVGKKAGDGYLKGLQDSLKKIDAAMTKIVKALVSAIKRELKIKSPSQVMADVGLDTMAGLALGITTGGPQAISAITGVANQIATQAAGSLGRMVAGMQPGGPADASVATAGGRVGGSAGTGLDGVSQGPPPAPGSGVTVNVDMSGSTVREEPDIDKIGKTVGFNVVASGLV